MVKRPFASDVRCRETRVSTDVATTTAPARGWLSGPVTVPVMISVVAPTWAAAGPGINAARRKKSGQTRRDLRLAAGRRTQNGRGGGISMGSRLQHRGQGTGRARGTSVRPRRALVNPKPRAP